MEGAVARDQADQHRPPQARTELQARLVPAVGSRAERICKTTKDGPARVRVLDQQKSA
jgi:hypothetical protein